MSWRNLVLGFITNCVMDLSDLIDTVVVTVTATNWGKPERAPPSALYGWKRYVAMYVYMYVCNHTFTW